MDGKFLITKYRSSMSNHLRLTVLPVSLSEIDFEQCPCFVCCRLTLPDAEIIRKYVRLKHKFIRYRKDLGRQIGRIGGSHILDGKLDML